MRRRRLAYIAAALGGYWAWEKIRPEAIPAKIAVIRRYYRAQIRRNPFQVVRFILLDRETTNFTYDIANRAELASFLSRALAVPHERASTIIDEVDQDDVLRQLLEARLRQRRDRHRKAQYGRRIGWYALVRLYKPRLLVETGIHDGLGSAILLRALERNASEGEPGHAISFDVDPTAGWLVPDVLNRHWTRCIGDIRQTLEPALSDKQIDIFIHDSDHTPTHERWEFEVALAHCGPHAMLISDNSHFTTVLAEFADQHGFQYGFFREQPVDHFYPGGGIGLALR